MLKTFKYFTTILAISFLLTACSQKIVVEKPTILEVKQDTIVELSKQANDKSFNQQEQTDEYFSKYFRPWKQSKLSYSEVEAKWGFSYKNKKVYLENHNQATKEWFDKKIENANFENYNKDIKKAITLKNTNVRVLPTNSPMFYNPSLPGEGFPFDYNQNSLLKINTPLIVSHFSKDRAWAFVESHFVGGWVEINSIAFVDDDFINDFTTNDYFIATKEKFAIYDPIFREYVKVGTIFPKKDNNFIVAKEDDNLNAKISYIQIEEEFVEPMPLAYTYENRARVLKEFMNEPYGWAGLLNNRDCSSFTQDYFSVFGKYLHRNSKAQTTNGKYFDISQLNLDEKKEFIRKNGIPFSTLVYLKGHIMLYIGIENNEPLVVHNVWSVKLKDKEDKEFRYIIGKTAITTLEPAKEQEGFTQDSNILKKVLGITIL